MLACRLAVAALLAASLAVSARAEQAGSATRTLGDVGQIAVPVSAAAIALSRGDRAGIGELALVSATTLAAVHALKPTVNQRRPNGGRRSFPSGHTASAFMGAAFLERRYGWVYGAPAYAVAAYVGYSRVRTKEHWTTDVVAGAVLGLGSNLVFTRRYHSVRLAPAIAPHGGVGVSALVEW